MITRAIILAATIAALITAWMDRPKPVQTVEVKYCAQNLYVAQRQMLILPSGFPVIKDGKPVVRWHKFWTRGYGLCSERDQYEFA